MHSGGYFIRKLEKDAPLNSALLSKFFCDVFKRGYSINNTASIISTQLLLASEKFFTDISSTFADMPGSKWKEISTASENMITFLTKNALIEVTDSRDWSEVIKVYNINYAIQNF